MSQEEGRPFDADELVAQIGKSNIFAISGGRVGIFSNDDGDTVQVVLPVSNGYRVSIELAWDDTWTVRREFVRKGVVSNKGELKNVYADQVGEIAYKASCFRNVQFGEAVA